MTDGVYQRRWQALGVLGLSLMVIGMDNTVLNVALPTLVRDLGASASQLQWIVDAYVLVFAGLLLTMGAVGDRFGRRRALDAGLLALVYGISEAPHRGWGTGSTLVSFATATVLLGAFVGWERRTTHPMLHMGFFRDPRFSAGSLSVTLVFFALFGSIFVLTQHLQFVLGYSALAAGLRVTPIATLVVSAPLSARLVERVGTKIVVAAGLLTVAVGLAVLAGVDVGDGYGPVGWSLALLGIGMGATMAPATDSIMGSLPLAKAGVGSAMNDTTRMVGGALGVAVIGSVMSSSYAAAVRPALAGLPRPAASAAGDSIGAAVGVARGSGPAAAHLLGAARAAFTAAMGDALLIGAAVAALGALLAVCFLPARPRRTVVASGT